MPGGSAARGGDSREEEQSAEVAVALALAGVALALALIAITLGGAALVRANRRAVAELRVPTATRTSKPPSDDMHISAEEGL